VDSGFDGVLFFSQSKDDSNESLSFELVLVGIKSSPSIAIVLLPKINRTSLFYLFF
jgi:hypothetical protein